MKKWLTTTLICSALTLFAPAVASGREIWDDGWYPTPCNACSSQPPDCAIGPAGVCPHECGGASTTCCGQGDTWTKYTTSCRVVDSEYGLCDWVWVKGPRICSTGNKCVAGELGLRAGQCNCGYSQNIYKACCSGATAVACQNYAIQDGVYPNEGVCPGAQVDCPSGNAALCCSGGPTNTPGPSPTPGEAGRLDMTTNRPD